MFKRGIRNIILAFSIVALVSSCSGYEKLLKSGDINLIYKKGIDYYKEGQYVKAVTLFEKVIPRMKGTEKSEDLDFMQAQCYYKMRDYVMAGHYFRTFVRTYFNSPRAEEADFLGAYCYYKLTGRPELDQTNTYKTLNAFTLFKSKFPGSDRMDEINKLIVELNEKLVEKSYDEAKLYYDLEKYKAAIVAIKNSLTDYPDTKYREELMFLKLKSNYLIALNSIRSKQFERYQNTVDEYYAFIDEFPKSRFGKEAEKIYNNSASYLADQKK